MGQTERIHRTWRLVDPSAILLTFLLTVVLATQVGCAGAAANSATTGDPGISVSISPTAASINTGSSLQFAATVSGSSNTAVTWVASAGSISSTGLYTAPSSAGTYTVVATSAADTSKSASATVTVVSAGTPPPGTVAVSVSPSAASIPAGSTLQLNATVSGSSNTAVTWSASAGSVSGTGLYTAPSTAGTYTVTATSAADTTKTASATITVSAVSTVSVSITPTSGSINTGGTLQFQAAVSGSSNTGVTWRATGGSISSSGLYTAPSSAGTYTVIATSVADTSKSASATVTVTAVQSVSVSISPTSASINTGATQQFSATVTGSSNTSVTWSASVGTISTSGLYTAPSSVGTYTVTATSVADTTKHASAQVTVSTPTISVTVNPSSTFLNAGNTQQFTAAVSGTSNTAVTWSATAGTISSSGLYTAPSTAGTYTVKATSSADSTKSGSASVTVSTATGGTLATIAGGMSAGSFAQVTNMAGWNGGAILNVTGGGQGTAGPITDYSDKMTWNPVTKEVYFYGGQHCPGACSNVNKLVKYSDSNNAWTVVDPTGWNDSHSYQDETLNPSAGTSGRFYYRPFNGEVVHVFDIASQAWLSDLPTIPMGGQNQCCGGLQYFPDRNSLIFVDGDWGVWEWSFGSSSWTCLASTNASQCGPTHTMASYPTFAQYDPVNKRVWLGGDDYVYTLETNGTLTARASAPFPIGANPQTTVTSDPVSGKLIAFNPSNAHVFQSDGTSWVDTGITSPFSDPIMGGLACTPVSTYGVVMCIYDSSGTVWLYKAK